MSTAIPEIELPVQLFVAGSAIGMLVATIRYHLNGELERWPLTVAYCGLGGFGLGMLLVLLGVT